MSRCDRRAWHIENPKDDMSLGLLVAAFHSRCLLENEWDGLEDYCVHDETIFLGGAVILLGNALGLTFGIWTSINPMTDQDAGNAPGLCGNE